MHLSISWFDYQKALEGVPYSCVVKSIEMVEVNSKIVNCQRGNGEMENEASFKNKTASFAITTLSDTKTNIAGWLFSPLLFCISHIPVRNELKSTDCGYTVHRTERQISHLLCMFRSEDDFENEIKLVRTIV